jgi:hypothetical protein
MSDLTDRLRAQVDYYHAELAGSVILDLTTAADVLDVIDAVHTPFTEDGEQFCHECVGAWPCRTHLLIHSMTLDDAIDALGTVHK